MVKEAKVRMARDRARKANQAQVKLKMARRKANVTSVKHARALTVANGAHGLGLFHLSQDKGEG